MEKSETGPQTSVRLCRLPVQPEREQGQTHPRALVDPWCKNQETLLRTHLPSLAADVPDRVTHSHRETSPPTSTPYEADIVAVEKQLEGTRITRKGDPHPQVAPFPPKVVATGRQCASQSTITPTKTCSVNPYRPIKRRYGCSLRGTHCKGNLVPSGKQVTPKLPGTKAVFLALKEF